MRLFKIEVTHYAPRDQHTAIQEYVVANDDREVFNYLADGYADWNYMLDNCECYANREEDCICKDIYEQIFIEQQDTRDVDDLYYGATQYGWCEVPMENLTKHTFIKGMINNGIAKDIRAVEVNECITYTEYEPYKLDGFKTDMFIVDEVLDCSEIKVPNKLRVSDDMEIELEYGNTTLKQSKDCIEIKIKK